MHKSLVLFPVLTLALAACATTTTSKPSPSASPSGSEASPGASAAVLHVGSTSLGKVLVDSRGHTVYLLTADSKGHATCNASCQAYWPPVSASGSVPHTLPGISASIGTAALPGGGQTTTAGGWPLYTFVKDTEAGDAYGQGIANFGGTWYVVSPSGQPIKVKAPSESPSSSGSGGY